MSDNAGEEKSELMEREGHNRGPSSGSDEPRGCPRRWSEWWPWLLCCSDDGKKPELLLSAAKKEQYGAVSFTSSVINSNSYPAGLLGSVARRLTGRNRKVVVVRAADR